MKIELSAGIWIEDVLPEKIVITKNEKDAMQYSNTENAVKALDHVRTFVDTSNAQLREGFIDD